MTEAEWLACTDPEPMLVFLRGKASERKLRLFTIACARLVWDRVTREDMREAVETAARYVDALASEEELRRASTNMYSYAFPEASREQREWIFGSPDNSSIYSLCRATTMNRQGITQLATMNAWRDGRRLTDRDQPDLLREIMGYPSRLITFNANWRTSTAVGLARTIYEDRSFDRLPILADALQDAGCDDEQLLAHCRSDGPHVRGCWAVDLVLGNA